MGCRCAAICVACAGSEPSMCVCVKNLQTECNLLLWREKNGPYSHSTFCILFHLHADKWKRSSSSWIICRTTGNYTCHYFFPLVCSFRSFLDIWRFLCGCIKVYIKDSNINLSTSLFKKKKSKPAHLELQGQDC